MLTRPHSRTCMINHEQFTRGVELFNAGDYFAAHEELEDVWREMEGEQRRHMQGLVQVAVAMHHHSTGNLAGARSVLDRASRNLAGADDELCGITLAPLRTSLRDWQEALSKGSPAPARPRLEWKRR